MLFGLEILLLEITHVPKLLMAKPSLWTKDNLISMPCNIHGNISQYTLGYTIYVAEMKNRDRFMEVWKVGERFMEQEGLKSASVDGQYFDRRIDIILHLILQILSPKWVLGTL